ncbi:MULTISPECIES: glycosyltransferase family A protein [Acidiphilium]|uniref:Glycosyl transferase family 2 n=1 Tax=Acidiphilium rubrum TaxID=526 RepID=A0A8G2FH36_ACIRU|nr:MULTISPECIES: glycosyltransferase family 2 protein [Acidiphilium]SIR22283.1 Glycosyl transferase family 2 [Acidiphilium rubrum]
MTLGVVIPYFQRTPGLLARAVRSALDQTGLETLLIVVVDDGSPHPAKLELGTFSEAERRNIVLIEQSNAGVSAARNRALDAMPDRINAIAFLDPDDAWHPGHLENANIALDSGADFYFADFTRPGVKQTRFERSNIQFDQHVSIDIGTNLYKYNKKFRRDLIQETIVGTSTVVLPRRSLGSARFRTDLTASEDLLTWFCTTTERSQVIFSSRCEAEYGEGVGLIAKSVWGTKRSLRVALDQSIMLKIVSEDAEIDDELRSWIALSRRDCRMNFVRTMLHRLRRLQPVDFDATRRFVKFDPEISVDLFRALVGRSE